MHELCVDAWLDKSTKGLAPEALLTLFDAAFAALWSGTRTTLGEVTLTAIADRVLHEASSRFPFFSSLTIEAERGIHVQELRTRLDAVREADLMKGIRFVLVELLTVLGNLTAEILTPELHTALSRVALPTRVAKDGGGRKRAPSSKRATKPAKRPARTRSKS